MSIWTELREALGISGNLADLALLFGAITKDPADTTGKGRILNHILFPSWARRKEHDDQWDALTNRLDPMEQNAMLQVFLPALHPEQRADLVVSAALRSSDSDAGKQTAKEAEMLTHLKRIAGMSAQTPTSTKPPTPPHQTLQDEYTHQMRVTEAVSLRLMKDPPERYFRVWAEKQAKRRFKDFADMAKWVDAERLELFGQWLDHEPVRPVNQVNGQPDDVGGALQRLQTAAADKKKQADKRSKRWF